MTNHEKKTTHMAEQLIHQPLPLPPLLARAIEFIRQFPSPSDSAGESLLLPLSNIVELNPVRQERSSHLSSAYRL